MQSNLIAPLTPGQYSHLMERWEYNAADETEVFVHCGDSSCYACKVGQDMADGIYATAATEDGVPTWLLPDGHRPAEAALDFQEFQAGRTGHLKP